MLTFQEYLDSLAIEYFKVQHEILVQDLPECLLNIVSGVLAVIPNISVSKSSESPIFYYKT